MPSKHPNRTVRFPMTIWNRVQDWRDAVEAHTGARVPYSEAVRTLIVRGLDAHPLSGPTRAGLTAEGSADGTP